MIEHSDSIAELASALVDFHDAVKNPIADQTAVIAHKGGGQHSYPFADLPSVLDAVRAPLVAAGLAVTQPPVVGANGDIGVETWLIHRSGEYMVFPPVWIPSGDDAKDIGAAITYSRRIGLLAALFVSPREDPDALPPRRSRGQERARPAMAEPAAPQRISTEQYAQLVAVANRKGKTLADLLEAVHGHGVTDPLPQLLVGTFNWLVRALEKMPDAFDPESGEQIALSDDEKATGFPEEVDPAADEGDGFDNFDDLEEASDGAPGQ